ncbi:MAG: di-trans,poly-cis-decaprenylcistransferase [Alphaproteobacteria bacterium]|nr:di-trans,poly-cis-decaprenylcistransferase [Alphaproteobacteria bacterium]
MDGNRRWAKAKGLPVAMGHKKGAENVQKIVRAVADLGINCLTLYAFSTENWQREESEVDSLMDLLREYLKSELKEIQDNGVRIVFIGERQMLSADIVEQMNKIENDTRNNSKMTLCIALSYGSRQEILGAVRKIATLAQKGDISPAEIDDKMFSDMLYTKDIPDPDLLIRTGGDRRVSNYLLWQLAYSEFYFSPTQWPDFNKEELIRIIADFNSRERRYGKN